MARKIHAQVRRGEQPLNIQEAAKRNGVKTLYMSMCTWIPGGKRKRAARQP